MGSGAGSSSVNTSTGAVKRASNIVPIKDGRDDVKVEDRIMISDSANRSIGEKKPKISADEGPSLTELSGYNSKRQEFEIEYDNDAEQLLADMEFKDTDTDIERELKIRVLRIYSKRLDERKRRKDFILERNLLHPDPFEKDLSPEEREICRRYRVFMRFHSKEEHDELLKTVVEEHRIMTRIQELQEARAAGCRTSAEGEVYIQRKRKREAEENACRMRENSQVGPNGKFMQRTNNLKGELESNPQGGVRGSTVLDSAVKDSSTGAPAISSSSEHWDVTGFFGADLLSEAEKQLCGAIKILPAHYLNMLHTMSVEILNGNVTKKLDAHGLFGVDPSKVDRVYDMLVKKGIAQP
ncbi:hypothetical protein RJ639_033265 [Escallonia herrerae]|uniref:SWIRM domain-containing protein n=1 Tax=Escallonia herrerae TaxID=1293975 RepID=A0AA88X8G8_9ASTE|nr:hypothetical protein RJ639_033265 [Escallonia herrerae]